MQAGTLAGNLSIKHSHPEFPSDVFIVLEALEAQVIVQESPEKQQTVSLASYLKLPMEGKIIRGFVLPAYSKQNVLFDSYKVSLDYFEVKLNVDKKSLTSLLNTKKDLWRKLDSTISYPTYPSWVSYPIRTFL